MRFSRRPGFNHQGLDALVTNQAAGVLDAREHVLAFHPGIPLDDRVDVISGRQHVEDMFDCKAMSTNDRLTAEDGGINDDTSEEVGFLQVLGRNLARLIPFEPISFLGSTRTSWHDRLSGTRVITLRASSRE